jgi:hypothetical protein
MKVSDCLPPSGSVVVFERTPSASYARTGERYKVTYHKGRHGYIADVHLTSVVRGTGTFDRPLAWQGAVWEVVERSPVATPALTIGDNTLQLHFSWRGSDYHQVGKTRVWVFTGHGPAREYHLRVEDCDGDWAPWRISRNDETVAAGDESALNGAFTAIFAAMKRIITEATT